MKKVNKKLVWVVCGFFLLLWGCATVTTKDIKITTKADPKAQLSGYKSYAWLGAAAILHDEEGRWKPLDFDADVEIKFLIDRELRKRGMSENSSSPDLIVAFALGVDMEALDLKVNPDTKMEVLENVPQGALLIGLIDSQTGLIVWAGAANAEVLENSDTQTAKARLDYAVTKMLKQLPK
jgi:hypothetical protein